METRLLTLVALLLLTACKGVSEKNVEMDFRKEYPTSTVLSVNAGEGDGSAAYFYIKYKKQDDNQVYEEEWQYMDTRKARWTVTHKRTIK